MNLEKINAMKQRMKEVQAQLEAEGEEALKTIFAEFFANNPIVEAVQWTQYTPYWCDGGPCSFYVNESSLQFSDSEDFVMYHEELDEVTEAHEKAFAEISEVESALFADLLLTVFGDHVQITATKEGFDVEEYEHD